MQHIKSCPTIIIGQFFCVLPLGSTNTPLQTDRAEERKLNPKRMQREINSQLQNKGIGTKAQQALKLQHVQGKVKSKLHRRENKEAEKERQFILRQEKKKAKHKGR